MASSYRVITPPTDEPLSLEEVKDWLRVDWTDDDAAIALLLTRARAHAETVTHRALAVQTIQQVNVIEQPEGGVLSGRITPGPNWYTFQEELGANPFGPAQFYFDLACPPVLSVTTIETKVTAWDTWTAFTSQTYLDDTNAQRLYLRDPVTANFYRFTYQAGYDNTTYFLPDGLKQAILDLIAYWYDHRDGEDVPAALTNRLLAFRVDWM